MKKRAKKLFKDENGQALALVALMLTVIVGFVALAVDIGMVAYQKSKMQLAADAAALAGALSLPNVINAKNTAVSYAGENGMVISTVSVSTPYKITPNANADPGLIEVKITNAVQFSFAKVLGINQGDISVRAVARVTPGWGPALPFVNLDDDYLKNSNIEVWEKTGPGDFESLWKDDFTIIDLTKNTPTGYFSVHYGDGITVTKGVVANIKQEIGYIFVEHKDQFVFSLSSEVMNDPIRYAKYLDMNNLNVIPLSDLVLLRVSFDVYEPDGNQPALRLTYKQQYSLDNLPADFFDRTISDKSRLVK